MSDETKREVFEDVLFDLENPHPKVDPQKMLDRYLAAMPDDLPVIPKAVSEHIKDCKKHDLNLTDSLMRMPLQVVYDTELIGDDTFALAWVLGVWSVEETGEIVKLEAEK